MTYVNFTVVNGVVTVGTQDTIDGHCTFQASGNIWSLDGPALGFLCSIPVTWVNQAVGRVAYDPRPINGSVSEVNFSAWGTAIAQPDGRFVISV